VPTYRYTAFSLPVPRSCWSYCVLSFCGFVSLSMHGSWASRARGFVVSTVHLYCTRVAPLFVQVHVHGCRLPSAVWRRCGIRALRHSLQRYFSPSRFGRWLRTRIGVSDRCRSCLILMCRPLPRMQTIHTSHLCVVTSLFRRTRTHHTAHRARKLRSTESARSRD
jgi:hypothetical protein